MEVKKASKAGEGIVSFKMNNQREWLALSATFFSLLNKIISLLSIFFYVRWTLPYLGKEMFGVWMALSTIITLISVFSDLGLGSSLVNHIAASKAKNTLDEVKSYTSSAFVFLSIMALILGCLFYLFQTGILNSIINGINNKQDILQVRNSLVLLFSIFLISLPFVTVDKTLEGFQLTYISSIWAICGSVLSLILTYFFTEKQLGITWLIASTVGVQSVVRIVYFFYIFGFSLKSSRPSFKRVSFSKTIQLLKSGLVFFLLNIFNVLAFQFDNVLISKEIGVGNVAMFSLMQKFMTISLFFWFYTISLWPAFAESHSKKDIPWIKKTSTFVLRLNFSLGTLFGIFLICFSDEILMYWSESRIESPSFTLKLGFALYVLLNGLIGTVSIVFNTGPLLKKHLPGFCIAAVVTILLKYFLLSKLGIDYLMYLSLLPFLLFYIIPCYFMYLAYVKKG